MTTLNKKIDIGEAECPEHHADGGDPLPTQHHSPKDHEGPGPCRCPVYVKNLPTSLNPCEYNEREE